MALKKGNKTGKEAEHDIGSNNVQFVGFDVHNPVFFVSSALIIIMVVLTLAFQEQASSVFSATQSFIANRFGWLLILAANIFVLFAFYLAFSRFGKVRIGGQDARPEFSTWAWFAMLFSAGMGIGIMFFGVAEPISHFSTPPFMAEAGTADAAQVAMAVSFFHWGIHAWAVYAVVGLALAFFAYNWGMPLTIRSAFYPLLGERIYGWMGDTVDTLAVLATLFGLATSLGLGVGQANAGLNYLFGVPDSATTQVILIAIITGVATLSVVAGLDGGVRRLSEINLNIAVVLLAFVIILGPTLFILNGFFQNVGFYVQNLPFMSTWGEAYEGGTWQNSWTIFYWAWWISWSPFVGMFIARVSKGRTVRQFMLGVLIVPSLVSFLWFSAFGGSAIFQALNGIGDITTAVNNDVATALFVMFDQFPLGRIASLLGIALVLTFFVTSSDSGSLVIDSITAGGKEDAPTTQRIFWAVTEGTVAAVLLLGGGLTALQTGSITLGLPFSIVLVFVCISLYKGLRTEFREEVLPDGKDTSAETAAVPAD